MFQLVNLYQPVFRRQPKILSTTTLIIIIAVVVLFMSLLYHNANATLQRLEHTVKNLESNFTQLDARHSSLRSNSPTSVEESIVNEILAIEDLVDERRKVLVSIDSLYSESYVNFGDTFETLAQIALPGLWLTKIQLDQDGSIEIRGGALDPKLVPRYLQLIADDPTLSKLTDSAITINREPTEFSEIEFVLSHNEYGDE